jgi:hypothetical protein
MSKKPPIHTVPVKSGGWTNKREGATRGDKNYDTKADAQVAGRAAAMRDKTEHLIHNKDGEIGSRNSYGNDPHPPKG